MDAIMTRASFLDKLRSARSEWDDMLAEVPRELLEEPDVEGDWSIKDIMAHVAWHEREMVEVLRAREVAGSPLWELPTNERNAAIYEENRHRTLDDVLSDSGRVFRQLLREVEALSDDDLNDPSRFKEMPTDWLPWKLIAENSYEHYPGHVDSIRNWLET
jgi:uncharacterized damage-inducible protein DinB